MPDALGGLVCVYPVALAEKGLLGIPAWFVGWLDWGWINMN